MSDQKPSVGRVVFFYGLPQGWDQGMAMPDEKEWKIEFRGPFAATIVKVNGDETVNLRVDYPSMLVGTDRCSELVLRVPPAARVHGPRDTSWWTWPPRA